MTLYLRHRRSSLKKVAVLVFVVLCLGVLAACGTESNETSQTNASPKQSAENSISVEWTPEGDCSLCHTSEGASMSDSACTASLHQSMTCSDCHTDSEKLNETHEGKTTDDRVPARLKVTTVSEDTCLSCHDLETLSQQTEGSTVLTDVNGLLVNPHDLPKVDNHSEIVCSDCHKMHKDSAETEKTSRSLCVSCHHAEVYECYTCHEHD